MNSGSERRSDPQPTVNGIADPVFNSLQRLRTGSLRHLGMTAKSGPIPSEGPARLRRHILAPKGY